MAKNGEPLGTPVLLGSGDEDASHLHESCGVNMRVLPVETALPDSEALGAAGVVGPNTLEQRALRSWRTQQSALLPDCEIREHRVGLRGQGHSPKRARLGRTAASQNPSDTDSTSVSHLCRRSSKYATRNTFDNVILINVLHLSTFGIRYQLYKLTDGTARHFR